MIRVCEYCGNPLGGKRAHARYCDSSCRADATRLRQELLGRSSDGDKALRSAQGAGAGSRGGNVRSVQEARDLQSEQRDKRDWAGAIDEQIRRTLIETGYFHADDLDPLGVPPEHCNLKGSRSAWFRNKGFMESTGVYRKVSHPAANGRKAPTYRITAKGRAKLVGVGVGNGSDSPPRSYGVGAASTHSGEKPNNGTINPEGTAGPHSVTGTLDRPGGNEIATATKHGAGDQPISAEDEGGAGGRGQGATLKPHPADATSGVASSEPLTFLGDEVGRERPRSAFKDADWGEAAQVPWPRVDICSSVGRG